MRDKVEQRLNELSERPSKGIVKGPEGRVVIMDFMLTSYVSKVAIDGAHRNALQLAVSQTCIMPSAVDCVDDDIVTTL